MTSFRNRLLEMALSEYGNDDGDEYFLAVPQLNRFKGGKNNWCGAFMATLFDEMGLALPSAPQVARKWLKAGEETTDPRPGDICVLWRRSPNDWRGHCAIFIKKDSERVWLLGGNQSGKVQIKSYNADRILGFRKI